jgi:hypothetical protein
MTPPVDEASGVVADAARIRAWAEHARSGDEFVYASRCRLPVVCSGAAEARRLADRELVHLVQRRIAGTDHRNYCMQRSSKAWPGGASATATEASGEAVPAPTLDAVYEAVERAARFKRPCPTDVQIADRVGCTRETVAAALGELADTGAIYVAHVRAPTLRRVTIAATGLRTGMAR